MVRRNTPIGSLNSTFVCFGFSVFLCCCGFSLLRATNYQVEIAQYKLAVNSALHKAQEEIQQIDRTVETVPIATEQKQKIKESTQKTDAVLDFLQNGIEGKSQKLLISDEEK